MPLIQVVRGDAPAAAATAVAHARFLRTNSSVLPLQGVVVPVEAALGFVDDDEQLDEGGGWWSRTSRCDANGGWWTRTSKWTRAAPARLERVGEVARGRRRLTHRAYL